MSFKYLHETFRSIMHSRYVGEFHSGLKDGKGVMLYRSGETREGNWDEDKLNGMYEYFGVYFL